MKNPNGDFLDASRDQIDLRAEEYLQRQRDGDEQSLDDFVAQFPSIAEEVRQVIETLLFVENFKPRDSLHNEFDA